MSSDMRSVPDPEV